MNQTEIINSIAALSSAIKEALKEKEVIICYEIMTDKIIKAPVLTTTINASSSKEFKEYELTFDITTRESKLTEK